MARYIDKDHWEEEIVIVDTSTPVIGGQPSWEGGRMLGGFSNISPAILADRTRYIRNRLEELRGDVEGELESALKKGDNLSDLDDIQQAKYNLDLNLVDNTRDADKPISDATQEALDEKVDKVDGKGLSDENYTLAEKDKLSGIEAEATKNDTDAQLRDRATHTGVQPISSVSGLQSELDSKASTTYVDTQLDAKVDKVVGKELSSNDFTDQLRDKLASLESSHFRGTFISKGELESAIPIAEAGDYADVDVAGQDAERYIWDSSDSIWVVSTSKPTPLTAAQIKQLYESNPDTNPFDDAAETKLEGIADGATANATNAQLRDRATHTGVQPISSVSGLQSELDSKANTAYVDAQLDDKADKTVSVEAGAGLVGGGSLEEDRTISVDFDTLSASKAQTLGGEPQSFVSGDSYLNVISWETGSHSSGTVLLDLDSSLNHSLEISGSVTVEPPSNADAGKTGDIVLNITSESVVSWSTQWKFLWGIPDIGATGEMWVVSYKVLDEDTIIASANQVSV